MWSPAFHPSAFSRDELIVYYSLCGIPVYTPYVVYLLESYFRRFTVMKNHTSHIASQ